MRILGGIMILGGCTGLGLCYRERLLGRIRELRMLASLLEMLMSEIRYGKATLPECCREITARVAEPYKSLFQGINQEYERGGNSFQEIFSEKMEQGLLELPLKEEDRMCFLEPFHKKGFQDGQMQLKSLEQGLGRIMNTIRQLEGEQGEKCRMAVGLGVMGGLFLVIILA